MEPELATEKENKWKGPVVAVSALFVVVIVGLFAFSNTRQCNYLVSDVPYHGNFRGSILWSDVQADVAAILDYWGDRRLSTEDIYQGFPFSAGYTLLGNLSDFFEERGYITTIVPWNTANDLCRLLKREGAPLMFFRSVTLGENTASEKTISVSAILVGVSEREGVVEIHDNFLGPNYKMSIEEFDTVAHRAGGALIIKPTQGIINQLTPSRLGKPYPSRHPLMDSPKLQDLQLRWITLSTQVGADDLSLTEELKGWQTISNHPAFSDIHPQGRLWVYQQISVLYRLLGNYEQAIRMLDEQVVPLNHDLDQAVGPWGREGIPEKHPWVFIDLGRTYVLMGALDKARQAYQEALTIAPNHFYAQAELEIVERMIISPASEVIRDLYFDHDEGEMGSYIWWLDT